MEKQVFPWRAKNSNIWCIIMFVAGFLMMCQIGAHLLHFYAEKQVFSRRAKNSYIWCIITWKSRFSHDATEKRVYIWCIIMFRSSFSHDAPKTLIFDALLCVKADFLMMHQKGAHLLHFYAEKQVFSCPAKNSYIVCINTWKSRFFSWRDRKKSVLLMHYYVS